MKRLAAGMLMVVCLTASAGTAFAGIHGSGLLKHHGVHTMERTVCRQGCWADADGNGICDHYEAENFAACRGRNWSNGECGTVSRQCGNGWGRGCR